MWKMRCLELCHGRTGEVTTMIPQTRRRHILPPSTVYEIVKDVIMCYARGTGYKPTVAHVVQRQVSLQAAAASNGTAEGCGHDDS